MNKDKNQTKEVSLEETEEEYGYGKYTIDSGGGAVTINITIGGNGNTVAVMSGKPSQPPNPPHP